MTPRPRPKPTSKPPHPWAAGRAQGHVYSPEERDRFGQQTTRQNRIRTTRRVRLFAKR